MSTLRAALVLAAALLALGVLAAPAAAHGADHAGHSGTPTISDPYDGAVLPGSPPQDGTTAAPPADNSRPIGAPQPDQNAVEPAQEAVTDSTGKQKKSKSVQQSAVPSDAGPNAPGTQPRDYAPISQFEEQYIPPPAKPSKKDKESDQEAEVPAVAPPVVPLSQAVPPAGNPLPRALAFVLAGVLAILGFTWLSRRA